MLLTVTGRKSGQPRTVPLDHLEGRRSPGHRGRPTPAATSTWCGGATFAGEPEAVRAAAGSTVAVRRRWPTGPSALSWWRRLVAMYPYSPSTSRTDREIPVVVLTPIRTHVTGCGPASNWVPTLVDVVVLPLGPFSAGVSWPG